MESAIGQACPGETAPLAASTRDSQGSLPKTGAHAYLDEKATEL
jgi:hypothetical protein